MSPHKTLFTWTTQRTKAALSLAEGHTIIEAAADAGVSEKSIDRWKKDAAFRSEVDRLVLMTGIAIKAERIRIVKRVTRQLVTDKLVTTERDLLEWLKYAQSETDGIKLDLTPLLTALAGDVGPLADSRPAGTETSEESSDDQTG